MGTVAMAVLLVRCAGPGSQCRDPSAEERAALADCQSREVTRRVYTKGGCDTEPYAVAQAAIDHCWPAYAERHFACLSDEDREAMSGRNDQLVIDKALAQQRQLRTFGQCLAAPPP